MDDDDRSFLITIYTNSPIITISSDSPKEDSLPPKAGPSQVYTRQSASASVLLLLVLLLLEPSSLVHTYCESTTTHMIFLLLLVNEFEIVLVVIYLNLSHMLIFLLHIMVFYHLLTLTISVNQYRRPYLNQRSYEGRNRTFGGEWNLELVLLSERKSVIGWKWIYTVKLNPDGSLALAWLLRGTLKLMVWIITRCSLMLLR